MTATRPTTGRGHSGLRGRLAAALVVVAVVTSVVVTVLAYVTNLYLVSVGATLVPDSLRRWVQREFHFAHPNRDTALTYAALAVLLLAVVIAVAAYSATRHVLSPVRQLASAAGRLAEGDLSVRLPVAGGDELADLVQAFNDMATALERNVEELRRSGDRARQFAGDVAHELRTPLAAMTAVTDMLDEHAVAVPDATGRAARLVSQEIRHLGGLVEALIDISRFDAGTADLVVQDVEVAAALRGCLATRGWSEAVATDVPEGLWCRLDPRRFDVVVANLVGNGLRHGRPPVTVRVWLSPGAGFSPGAGRYLEIEVQDHGPGIPPDALGRIFDRFFKLDTARGRSPGSGLGLAIAWENAKLHGGTIRAGNHPGGGAVFHATLALAEEGAGAARPDG